MLEEILSGYLSELRMEIAGTDSMDFREYLKSRELFVKEMLVRLESSEGEQGEG